MNDGGMTIFVFKEVEHNTMKQILDMMYYGEADVRDSDVTLFAETAKMLRITSSSCASLNLSETFFMRNTSETNNAPTCEVNLLKNNERNLPVQENGVMCNQDVVHEREGRSNSGFDHTDLQSIHSPESEERNISKNISGKNNYDHPNGRIPNFWDVAKDEDCTGGEDLQDELNPITFVAVPSVSVKSEEVDVEQSTSCISDLELRNPLEEYAHDFDTSNKVNFKREQEFLSESQMKMEKRVVIADDEPMKGHSGSNKVPFIQEMQQSFNESSTNFADNILTDIEPMESVHVISVFNDACNVEGTEDLKVKFESICEISEFNLKEEKSFDTDLDIGNTEDIEPLSLKLKCEAVNCGEEELSLIGCQHDMNQGLDSASTGKFKMKEVRVVLQRIKPLDAKDKDSKISALRENSYLLDTEKEKEFNNILKEPETWRSEQCVTVFSRENNYEGKCNPSIEKALACDIRHPIFVEGLKQVTNIDLSENPSLVLHRKFIGSSLLLILFRFCHKRSGRSLLNFLNSGILSASLR